MKTAIYIEDGVVQLVITPSTEFEKNALSSMRDNPLDVEIFEGSFYDCRGGWIRQTNYYGNRVYHSGGSGDDESLILTIRDKKEEEEK